MKKKMKKRLISLLMVIVLAFSVLVPFAIVSNASTTDEAKSTVLTLETNRITDVGNRHIKVKWEKVSGARAYVLEIADNDDFDNATSVTSKKSTQLYWNFADVPGGEEDTYYIRIKPRFSNNEYGGWSNVVVAEYHEPQIDKEVVEKIDFSALISKLLQNLFK